MVTQMPTRLELAEANRLALAVLARKIETTGERWMDGGGVVALVGATGVGKTTLIAKLAARWVMRHGTRDIALISTDSVRIGAQEQVQTLGRLLGVPAYAIDGAAELAGCARSSRRQAAGADRHRRLEPARSATGTKNSHCLPPRASAWRRHSCCPPADAGWCDRRSRARVSRWLKPATRMLTKLDEATSLGGAISTVIRAYACR